LILFSTTPAIPSETTPHCPERDRRTGFTKNRTAGKSAMDADLFAELELVDSQSGERLGAVVKKGIGTEVKEEKEGADKGEKKVVLDNLKPVLDKWSKLAADFAGSYLNPH